MLNRPRSSLPTTRRIKASRFSARSSGGMSRVPIAAWNVRLSRLRTRTVFRKELIRFVPCRPRPEDDAESLADHRHERRFRNEEVVRCREGPRLPLVARVLLDLLRLDHEVRGVPRLQGELSRREDADADRLPASFRQDDVLFDAILRDRKINIAKVHGDLDGLFERTGLGGLEQLLDGLDRMLVRQGRSPPAVRAARWPPAEERRRKSVALIRLCGRATPGPSSANYEQDSTHFQRPSRGIDDPSGVAQELSVGR